MFSIEILDYSFIPEEKIIAHKDIISKYGAYTTFVGTVRDKNYTKEKQVRYLFIEDYHPLTKNTLEQIAISAINRWNLNYVLIVHRIGRINIYEPIVLALTVSNHREESFMATNFIMDKLKTEAPFWKKEFFTDNSSKWVTMNNKDIIANKKWDN